MGHLPIRRDPTRPQPVLQQRTGGETIIVIGGGAGAGAGAGAAQGAAKPTVTNLPTVTTQTTVAAPAGTAPPAKVAPPPALGTGGSGAALPSGTGALPVQQPAPTQSLLPVTAGADPRGFRGGGEVAVVVGLVSVVWGGLWVLV